MTIIRQPDQLVNLSLFALTKYMYNLIDRYFENSYSIKENICWHLEHLFKDTLPQSLTNKVTESLLSTLDSKVTYIDDNISKLLDFFLFPAVTKLDFCSDILHHNSNKVFPTNWNGYIIPAVLSKISALQNLKVLRLRHTFYGKYVFPSSLIEFTYHNNCDKEILEQVSVFCKELKKLDLCNSTLIGDSCIEFILEFKFLEHVDLFDTYINEDAMTDLLKRLAANKQEENIPQLKSFGCSNLTGRQFEILIHHFTQLNSLKFSRNTGCDLKLLGNLKYLKSFSISYVSSVDMELIVDTVGSQLIVLHFGCNEQFDLSVLANKCIVVECLHINSVHREIVVPTNKEMNKLPGLKSVKCLYAHFYCNRQAVAYLISTCREIQVLEVNNDTDGEFIADVILKNPMTELRELNWWCSRNVKEIPLRFVQQCPNLEVIRGYYVWKKHGNANNDIPLNVSFGYDHVLC